MSHVTDMDRRKATLQGNSTNFKKHDQTDCTHVNFQQADQCVVPEAKSKSHDALAVSNASHTDQQTTPVNQHRAKEKNTAAFHD